MHIKVYFGLTNLNKRISFLLPQDNLNTFGLKTQNPPVFLIGAPRSGTTLIYQWLTNVLDIDYVDNLNHLFPKNINFGKQLSNFIYRNKAHNTYSSYFGRTQHLSLHAPSEAGDFFSLSDYEKRVQALLHKNQKPWIFKNLTLSTQVNRLTQANPDAKFIVIKRDLLDTALSIYDARIALNIDKEAWWSAKPSSYYEIHSLPLHQRIIRQVIDLNTDIEKQIKEIREEQKMTINYDIMHLEQETILNEVESFIGAECTVRENAHALVYKQGSKNRENHPEYASFVNALEQVNARTNR